MSADKLLKRFFEHRRLLGGSMASARLWGGGQHTICYPLRRNNLFMSAGMQYMPLERQPPSTASRRLPPTLVRTSLLPSAPASAK
jgi:hypothetical protein